MKASASVVIDRGLVGVWDYVSEVENLGEWLSGMSEPRRASGGEFGVGSTFTSKYAYAGKTHDITCEVIEFEPPNRETVRSTSGPLPFLVRFELEAAGEGTGLTTTFETGPEAGAASAAFALGGPLIRRRIAGDLESDLRTLKAKLDRP